jgi:hypothetical protein
MGVSRSGLSGAGYPLPTWLSGRCWMLAEALVMSLSYFLHGFFMELLGLPHSMLAGLQKRVFQEKGSGTF